MRSPTPLMTRRRIAAAAALAFFLIFAGVASAAPQPRIVNGLLTSAFASTGALLKGTNPNTAGAWCSGTLIGCRTFLTAQHCVEGFAANDFWVYLQHGGMLPVQSIALVPAYNFPVGDIAVLTLGQPVSGIRPARINTIADPPFGSSGTIAGFGRSGGANDDYGLKRMGKVSTSDCIGVSDATSVCWDFLAPFGPAGEDSNTCNADSGGPLFLTLNGEQVVAGVTSGGNSEDCLADDHSYDADVYFYRGFIQDAAGTDLEATSCGDLSQIGDGDTAVHGFSGQLNGSATQALHSFAIPPNTDILRVAINAVDDGIADFDLYLRAGSAPTTTTFDCSRNGPNQFGVCEVPNPPAGTWYAMVHRFSGSGSYQVTATVFAAGCSDPNNEGAACDDANPCTVDDQCSAGSCSGSAAIDGTSCGAGTLCTGELACQAGICLGDGGPRTDCQRSLDDTGAFLSLRASAVPSRERLQWKWTKGSATADFGDPTSDTAYALCIYDQIGGSDSLVMSHSLAPGFGWTANRKGFRYSDRLTAQDGIRSAKLKFGAAGRAGVMINGKGIGLQVPQLPLQQDSQVVVQLVNSENRCWEGRYSTKLRNDADGFKARGQ
ncbi:MAG TPA: trypsin-like serine protease [Terriglobales bacterium]|nr:trypsin-like serine protease [Terriglobales bacterium]